VEQDNFGESVKPLKRIGDVINGSKSERHNNRLEKDVRICLATLASPRFSASALCRSLTTRQRKPGGSSYRVR
jgi:hypothetical protein